MLCHDNTLCHHFPYICQYPYARNHHSVRASPYWYGTPRSCDNFFPTPSPYSHGNLMVDTRFLQNVHAGYFLNFPKQQHTNEPFKMMVCRVVTIIDCLTPVIDHEHNRFFSYRAATTKQLLLRMIAVFYCATFKKNSLTRMGFILHGNHTRMVFTTW